MPVPHRGDRVADAEHLLEVVRDEHDRSPRGGQRPDRLEQPLGLVAREGRGRLVHQEQPGVPGDRAQDLDLLLLGGAQRADDRLRVEPEARPLVELVEAAAHLARADDARGVRLDPEHHVLDHRAGRHERDLLGDRRDSRVECVARRVERDVAAVDEQLALVGPVHAADHLGERRLPGAVLADEAVDVPGPDRDRDVVERLNAAEALRDAARFDEGARIVARPLVVNR